MNINTIVVGAVALVIGLGGGYLVTKGQQPAPMVHNMDTTMNDMTADLHGKTGDEFDRAFLSGMIVHHEGAVAMAQAALQSSNHQEIKDMAKAIISAQTTEITQMKMWGKNWYNQ